MANEIFKRVSTADDNAASVVARPVSLVSVTVNNVNAAVRYLKLFNLSASPTVGTTVPTMTISIPAGSSVTHFFGQDGIGFPKGISMCMTTEATDAGTTGVSASEHVVNIQYKNKS